MFFQPGYQGEVLDPVGTDALGDIVGKLGVADAQPATLRDAVGLVLETLRIEHIPGMEHVVLQNLRMDFSNAVDAVGTVNGKVRHANDIVGNDCIRFAIHALCHQFTAELCVDGINNIENFRQQIAEQIHVPFFQRFHHDRVVRIAECFLSDFECFLERESFVFEKPNQLRNRNGGMRIVELDRHVFGEITDRVILALIPHQDILQAGGRKEVLLF